MLTILLSKLRAVILLDPSDQSRASTWLDTFTPFLVQHGGGLAVLSLLDLLDAGHHPAAPIMVVWIEGRLNTLLGQLGEEGNLEPWKVLLQGASQGVWNLYLHNVPAQKSFLEELPPKNRNAFLNRANFIRLPEDLITFAETKEQRSRLRASLVAMLVVTDGPRSMRLREVYPEEYLQELPFSGVNENAPEPPYAVALSIGHTVSPITASDTIGAPELALLMAIAESEGAFDPISIEDARERVLASIVRRRGQQAFREALIQRYEGRCVVTGCDVVYVLEAAHIIPYQGSDTNHPENGLLLRADIHTLFDLGLLAIGADLRVILHSCLLTSTHSDLQGRQLILPADSFKKPSLNALALHLQWAGLK